MTTLVCPATLDMAATTGAVLLVLLCPVVSYSSITTLPCLIAPGQVDLVSVALRIRSHSTGDPRSQKNRPQDRIVRRDHISPYKGFLGLVRLFIFEAPDRKTM